MAGYLLNNLNSIEVKSGIKRSLISKLDNVLNSLSKGNKKSAANQFAAFINEVEAQSAKSLTQQQAEQLKLEVEAIITVINQ